ncbi:iron-containing redox enzyme family protein [Gulosibacter macacae]|uniref:Iron-containing redox enzyme family protein n=1 Tax=Gulosibacter macacae TaxID=2488791 RepID=A0A3P3VS48_9MICO|nr:iron-containing redox enzyme family protein [Gulosibacter macacae]RRJ85612.1 iron-containing redox enzyme family protein [Gulosibacter macacae]
MTTATLQANTTAFAGPPAPRGPLSKEIIQLLRRSPTEVGDAADHALRMCAEAACVASDDLLADDDVQLALFCLYLPHYGPLDWAGGEWEWHPGLIAARSVLEAAFERELRARVDVPEELPSSGPEVAELLFDLTGADTGPSLAKWASKHATDDQLHEFLMQRSIYTLREADPHSWAIPRLRGRAKAALVEIQSDEYGGGRPAQMHARIFARAMAGLGLDPTLDRYLDVASTPVLASMNTMSLFGLNRRLRGAIAGHLTAFEMTSSIPNRLYGNAFRRHGYGDDVTYYFDEHVEADAVHEQIAANDLAGALAEDEPELLTDIIFGAAACLLVDGLAAAHMLDAWQAGESSLYSHADGSVPERETVFE